MTKLFFKSYLYSQKCVKQKSFATKKSENMTGHVSLTSYIHAFSKLSSSLKRVSAVLNGAPVSALVSLAEKNLHNAAIEAEKANPWFTRREIVRAFDAISAMITEEALLNWTAAYPDLQKGPGAIKTVAVIMAGNLPLVGFHDLLCVIISGHRFLGKLSSQDALLPVAFAGLLTDLAPGLKGQIKFTNDYLLDADAIIATGSDNTARYFEYHHGNKPHIIRKNRNATAVLTGAETEAELISLGEDTFAYYGLGCRSVSHIFIPSGFSINHLAEAWQPFNYLLLNKKYRNNLHYHRALYAVSDIPYIPADHCIFIENARFASPLSVIHYTQYSSISETERLIRLHASGIQCVVSNKKLHTGGAPVVPFGQSQQPKPGDYADGIDTIRFLAGLS